MPSARAEAGKRSKRSRRSCQLAADRNLSGAQIFASIHGRPSIRCGEVGDVPRRYTWVSDQLLYGRDCASWCSSARVDPVIIFPTNIPYTSRHHAASACEELADPMRELEDAGPHPKRTLRVDSRLETVRVLQLKKGGHGFRHATPLFVGPDRKSQRAIQRCGAIQRRGCA